MGFTFLKVRLALMVAPFLAAIAWLGMGTGAHHYDQSPRDVKLALTSAYVPTAVLGSTVKGSRVTLPDNDTVVTALLDENGDELARFVTTVLPDGEGSSVKTEVQPPKGVHADRAEQAMNSQAFTMSLLEKVAAEHVAAAIEHRSFDMLAINPTAKAMANAVPGMGAQIEQANRNAAAFSRYSQDEADDSWADGNDYDDDGGDDWGS